MLVYQTTLFLRTTTFSFWNRGFSVTRRLQAFVKLFGACAPRDASQFLMDAEERQRVFI